MVISAADYQNSNWYVAASNNWWHPLAITERALLASDFQPIATADVAEHVRSWFETDGSGFSGDSFERQVAHAVKETAELFALLDGGEIYIVKSGTASGFELLLGGVFFLARRMKRGDITFLFASVD